MVKMYEMGHFETEKRALLIVVLGQEPYIRTVSGKLGYMVTFA